MNKTSNPLHIIVGMSGGVDSSVAAFLLKAAGHFVEGIFMKNWEDDDTATYCNAAQDLADAQSVCDQLQINLRMVNFADKYWERVFAHFLQEYRLGRTPNPDVLCNKEIKFKAFLDYAKSQGADRIATGHYVRVEKDTQHRLLKGHDAQKDQSYFLHSLNEFQLSQSLFPVGGLTKQKVRALAQKLGLKNHAKKDSTGICFIGERRFKTFLQAYLPASPGEIETIEGDVIGRHDGLMFYTIGQRQGLNIGGLKGKDFKPWYVARKDLKRNILVVVQGNQHPALFRQSLLATSIHWINQSPPAQILMAKTRYRQQDQLCTIEQINMTDYRIHFEQSQRAITPGQSIVFYQGDICLGGGIIKH